MQIWSAGRNLCTSFTSHVFIADREDEDEEEEEEEVQEEQEEEKYVLKNKSGLVNVTLCLIVVV